MKFYIILDCPAIKIERMVYFMKNQKNNNHSIAFDILVEEKKRTRFWFVSCVVVLVMAVLSHIVKGGAGNGR